MRGLARRESGLRTAANLRVDYQFWLCPSEGNLNKLYLLIGWFSMISPSIKYLSGNEEARPLGFLLFLSGPWSQHLWSGSDYLQSRERGCGWHYTQWLCLLCCDVIGGILVPSFWFLREWGAALFKGKNCLLCCLCVLFRVDLSKEGSPCPGDAKSPSLSS